MCGEERKKVRVDEVQEEEEEEELCCSFPSFFVSVRFRRAERGLL